MNASEINRAKNPLLRLALPALQRAAKNACEQARIHNTRLVIWRDNRVVKLSPDQACEQSADYRADK